MRGAGSSHWTVLKTAFMMDNYAQPKSNFMFPHLRESKILTALSKQTTMQLTASEDVGAFAQSAFSNPAVFDRRNIDLATAALTMEEVAGTLSRLLHKPVQAISVTPAEAIAAGLFRGWVNSQEWDNEVGYRADIKALAVYPVPLTNFAEWVTRHADQIFIDV